MAPISDTPGTWNPSIYAGQDWAPTLTVAVGGTPVNLTGYTARMMAKPDYTASTATLSLTTGGSGITLGGTAGTIALSQTSTQTAALGAALSYAQTQLLYDLELVSSGTVVTRLLQGVITVYPEVTR